VLCTIFFATYLLLFLLVNSFPGFSQNVSETRQVAACSFSKEFRARPGKLSTTLNLMEEELQVQLWEVFGLHPNPGPANLITLN
jgi:hypothetical protein